MKARRINEESNANKHNIQVSKLKQVYSDQDAIVIRAIKQVYTKGFNCGWVDAVGEEIVHGPMATSDFLIDKYGRDKLNGERNAHNGTMIKRIFLKGFEDGTQHGDVYNSAIKIREGQNIKNKNGSNKMKNKKLKSKNKQVDSKEDLEEMAEFHSSLAKIRSDEGRSAITEDSSTLADLQERHGNGDPDIEDIIKIAYTYGVRDGKGIKHDYEL